MAVEQQIDMSLSRFARELRLGCIRLEHADALSLVSTFVDIIAAEITITLFARPVHPWNGVSLVMISMYKLPRGRAAYREELEFFSGSRKQRVRLPEGIRFDETVLEIRKRAASWKHAAFARSGRDIIHAYESEDRAILIRFCSKAGTALDNPLFEHVHKNLSLFDNQWVAELPRVQPNKSAGRRISDRVPGRDVRREIGQAIHRARERLELDAACNPREAVAAIYQLLESVRKRKPLTADARKNLAVELGALWGDALCQSGEWQWRCVKPDAETEVHAVCNPRRSHAVDPIRVIHGILSSRKVPNNSLLLFNMITADRLPLAPDGACLWLE